MRLPNKYHQTRHFFRNEQHSTNIIIKEISLKNCVIRRPTIPYSIRQKSNETN
jgi:hypothetical protein